VSTLDLTRADLIRALGRIAERPAVDRAVRARAEALAGAIGEADPVVVARVLSRGPAVHVVAVSGPGLFAREFGALAEPAGPLIGRAIAHAASGEV
jgi:hypothetical protein